jgi:hypothetical protein
MKTQINLSQYRNCGSSTRHISVQPHVTLWTRGAHNTLGRYFMAATVKGQVVASADWSTDGNAYVGGYRSMTNQLKALGLLA